MAADEQIPLINRELSWLSFNERVLQEAEDPRVPLFERIKFLAIYSSNLDEFFRVRVASVRSLLRLKKKSIKQLGFNPAKVLKQIHGIVTAQQERFGEIYRSQIVPALQAEDIHILGPDRLEDHQAAFLVEYFAKKVQHLLHPVVLSEAEEVPFLKNASPYLVTELWPQEEHWNLTAQEPRYAIVELPSPPLPRFVVVPSPDARRYVMFLDDVIRHNLPLLYPEHEVGDSYAIKLTRDAELYLEDEYGGNLIELIRKSLNKRDTGVPARFLYDLRAPYAMVSFIRRVFKLETDDMILGGRYHNLNDLFTFPTFGLDHLSYPPFPALTHPTLSQETDLFKATAERDHLLHFPYQSYKEVLRFLRYAAQDPAVEAMWISLYRVASNSAVAKAMMEAAQAGKQVTAFVEVKARFDEAPNLYWGEQMEKAGVKVLYSLPGLKVHAKMALVARREAETLRYYTYLSTGNFNEKTAHIYSDFGLLTADPRLGREVRDVFAFLEGTVTEPTFEHLLVAPFDMREKFYALIDHETQEAEAGRTAWMMIKMNSLEDEEVIERLYAASQAGVRIQLIIRGICRLIPGVQGLSENIEIVSIVDRYLEHARVYWFCHSEQEVLYLASADWMRRNLSRRIEVGFPILDPRLQDDIKAVLRLQWADKIKARIIDKKQRNAYRRSTAGPPVQAQADTYHLLAERLNTETPVQT